MNLPQPSDFEQVWRAAAGDLTTRARYLTRGDRDRADEILAITAMKALTYWKSRPDRIGEPSDFLFVVLRHVFLDNVRLERRERTLVSFEDLDALDVAGTARPLAQQIEDDERITALSNVLARLSDAQRSLFRLRFILDVPYPVIAGALQISEPLARKRVELLRRRLRRLLEPDGPPQPACGAGTAVASNRMLRRDPK